MRIVLTVSGIVFSWSLDACSAGEASRADRKAEPVNPAVLLREASELALKQDKHQHYWLDGVLQHIGEAQIRAGDFDGALRSIRGSSDSYCRNWGLLDLAQALARVGKRERAFDILPLLDASWCGGHDSVKDRVQAGWIEHLIGSGELGPAAKAIEQLQSERYRPDVLRKVAVAYAKSGNPVRATTYFTLALNAADDLKEDCDRARAAWEIATAQLSVGKVKAAKATCRRLIETNEFKDPWAKLSALRESAVLMAKANDEQTAHRLFRQAIAAQKAVRGDNKLYALKQIAIGQASVGHIDDALKTAWMIKHSETNFTQDGDREEALCAIAVAQVKGNDVDGAVRTALSVEHFLQYRDDAIHGIVEHLIVKGDLKTALTTAGKVDNASRRASALLKVATAHAKSGDRKKTAQIAGRIQLNQKDYADRPAVAGQAKGFDYRFPRTWAVSYDSGFAFSFGIAQTSAQRAAEVARTARALSQALGQKPAESYAKLFDEIMTTEVTRDLARTHAALGDASDATAWASQIGRRGKVKEKDDYDTLWALKRRIHALIGVAEGILDRSNEAQPQEGP